MGLWDADRSIGDRALELFAAALLGLATVSTAWCAYQAARWNDDESASTRASNQARLEAARAYNLGVQRVSYDATIAALYAQAVVEGQTELQRFYKENLVRPAFLPVIEEAEQRIASGEDLTNLFENQEYISAQAGESIELDAKAQSLLDGAQEAADNASNYIQTTIFMASALFFAGITSNFRSRTVRLLLLLGAAGVFAFGAATLAELPVA